MDFSRPKKELGMGMEVLAVMEEELISEEEEEEEEEVRAFRSRDLE